MQSRHTMRFTHCTNIRRLRQVRNWGAVPIVRLIEANLRRRRGIWQVVNVFRPRSMPGKVNHGLIPIILQICRAIAVAELAVRIARLHVIPQHQFPGVRLKVHLLVHPRWHRIAVVVIPCYKTGHKRQIRLNLTVRISVVGSTRVNRLPFREH